MDTAYDKASRASFTYTSLCFALLFLLLTPFSTQLTVRTCHAAQVQLEWSPSDCYQVTGYKIHYGTGSGSYSKVVDVGPVTHHTLFGLDDYTTYYFAATAYDSNGNQSGFSNEVIHLAQSPIVDDGGYSGNDDPYDGAPDDTSYDNGGTPDPWEPPYEDHHSMTAAAVGIRQTTIPRTQSLMTAALQIPVNHQQNT
jgi:hypothetical protein